MIILFTTSKYPTSWLIRKLTGDDCSHCALLIGGKVIHSNFLGIQNESLKDFLVSNTIIHQVPYEADITREQILEEHKDARYDFGALLYAGLRLLCPILPKVNLWQTTGMFLCTEFITDIISDKEDSLVTPHQLYIRLKKD